MTVEIAGRADGSYRLRARVRVALRRVGDELCWQARWIWWDVWGMSITWRYRVRFALWRQGSWAVLPFVLMCDDEQRARWREGRDAAWERLWARRVRAGDARLKAIALDAWWPHDGREE